MTEKCCPHCGVTKPISEFGRNRSKRDGLQSLCDTCKHASQAKYYHRHQVVIAAKHRHYVVAHRDYYSSWARAHYAQPDNRAKLLLRAALYRKQYPERARARRSVRTAIRKGALLRQPCAMCGRLDAEAHHDDYSKPLEVRWLCAPRHRSHHAALRKVRP